MAGFRDRAGDALVGLVRLSISALTALVIAYAVLSWVPGPGQSPFADIIERLALAFEAGLAHPETLIEDRPVRFGGDMAHVGAVLLAVGAAGLALVVGVVAKNMTDDFFVRHNALLFWSLTGAALGTTLARLVLGHPAVKMGGVSSMPLWQVAHCAAVPVWFIAAGLNAT
mgnify:CR=1 FL=1